MDVAHTGAITGKRVNSTGRQLGEFKRGRKVLAAADFLRRTPHVGEFGDRIPLRSTFCGYAFETLAAAHKKLDRTKIVMNPIPMVIAGIC